MMIAFIKTFLFRATCAAFILTLTLPVARAGDWLFLEMRMVPNHCKNPLDCLHRSRLLMRNMLNVPKQEQNSITSALNSAATIRGIQDSHAMKTISPALHALPPAEKLAPLVKHPGVYFDSEKLDAAEETATFSIFVRNELKKMGFRELTKEEWENTPGRPTLGVSYTARTESEGCIIPFSVSVSIKEETVYTRDPSLKTSGSVWSGAIKENLANKNYTPMSALKEAMEKLTVDYTTANTAPQETAEK